MSTINAVINRQVTNDESAIYIKWGQLINSGDVGDAQSFSSYSLKTFIASGTFAGSASVVIEGCNDITVGDWTSLSNRQGTAMNFTALGMNTSQDVPIYVRPRLTAGAGAAVTVTCAAHRQDISNAPT